MSLNSTVTAERIHIGFFGKRNAGKSSLINEITNQEVSLTFLAMFGNPLA